MTALLAYLRQPTSIAGIAAMCGVLIGFLSGNTSWQGALPVIVGAIVAIALPENPAAKAAVATLVTDAIAAQRAFVPGEANLTIVSSSTHTV